jgi:hypothetical protein
MSCDAELYFYDELTAPERTAFEAHLPECAACRAALAELRDIRAALASLADEAERSEFDWRSFMRRLDRRLDAEGSRPPKRGPAPAALLALAASIVIGIAVGVVWQRQQTNRGPASDQRSSGEPATSPALRSSAARAAAEHFDRAKIVLLGLANKAAGENGTDDWSYERQLAASLLPDTRLHRIAALSAGDTELADLLNDLEILLLQASFASEPDRATLRRLQRYINRRDLLVRVEIGI